MSHLQQVTITFVFKGFTWFSAQTAIISLNSINQLIFVMVKCCIFSIEQTEFLNIIYISFGFKGLTSSNLLVSNSTRLSMVNWQGRGRKQLWLILWNYTCIWVEKVRKASLGNQTQSQDFNLGSSG
jgi:hypothetical protein